MIIVSVTSKGATTPSIYDVWISTFAPTGVLVVKPMRYVNTATAATQLESLGFPVVCVQHYNAYTAGFQHSFFLVDTRGKERLWRMMTESS